MGEPVYVIVRNILVALLRLFFRWRFIDVHNIPAAGPAIVVANHISNFDPLCVALLVDAAKRRPRFLAKASLWRGPLGVLLDGCRQIPVYRGTGDTRPMEAAEAAIARGEVVVIYPEGTITDNPDLTPMQGKTGVARLALATGAPVIPVAVWGAQWIAGKKRRFRYRGHRLIMCMVGEPMRFDELAGRQSEPEVRRAVTDRVMDRVGELVRQLHELHPDGPAVPELKEAG